MLFEYYVLFSFTTAICITLLNVSAHRESRVNSSIVIFCTISFLVSFLFSPIFFLIYLTASDSYKKGIIKALQESYD